MAEARTLGGDESAQSTLRTGFVVALPSGCMCGSIGGLMKRYLDRIVSIPDAVISCGGQAIERARAKRPLSIIEHYAITFRLSVDTNK